MRAANLLLLELMLQGATANIIVNPYTEYNEPPPDAVACSSTGYCQGIAECGGVAYCADVGSGRTCMEKLASGSAGVPANACSDPQAKGFIKCESGQLYRHCSPRNRDGGMYDTTGLQSPPSTPPTPPAPSPFPPPAPQSPPPDFANQVEGQLFFLGFGLIVLLIVATLAYLFHVRWRMDSEQLEKSAAEESKDIKGRMRKGRGQALTFITRWVCIENGLEVFVEFVNYAASVNATMGSPNSFYIAFGVNLGMVILELVEHCRTRRNGGKQTPWDRFWFGQWADATRKNYYAKYSTRILLFFGFLLNMAMFPLVLINVNDVTSTYASEDEAGSLYFTQVEMVMRLAGANEFKFIAGSYALVENVGVTLIEPFLAILPAPLQCLRIGPLASPATYTARDWFITNVLCMWVAYLYFALNYKQSSLCGPPDGWVWNTEKLIGGVMRRYPSWGDDSPSCDEYPQTVYEELLIVQLGKDSLRDSDKPAIYVGIIFVFVFPLLMTCLMLCMKRKLPGWGEPPADHAPAPDKNGGKLGMAKKVANAAMCAYSTASEVGGGVSAVGSSLDVAGVSLPPKLGVADVAGVAASKIQQQV